MATIATLAANLKLNTTQFSRSVKTAQRNLRNLQSSAMETVKRVAKIGAAFTAAVAGGIAFFTARTFKAMDATAKMADVLGLTTEQLSSYQLAAELSGISTGDLETALRRMLKTVSDANEGLTTAKRAFQTLGLDEARLELLSTHEAFGEILDGLAAIPNAFDRARVAQDVFGRSGVRLIKLAQEGAGGLERVTEEARELGIAFSRVDAKQVEQANDALARVRASLRGIFVQFAPKIANFVTVIADKFTEWAKQTNLAEKGANALFSAFKKVGVVLLDLIQDSTTAVLTLIGKALEGLESIEALNPMSDKFGQPSQSAIVESQIRQLQSRQEDLRAFNSFPSALRSTLSGLGLEGDAKARATELKILSDRIANLRKDLVQARKSGGAGTALLQTAKAIETGPRWSDQFAEAMKKAAEAAKETEKTFVLLKTRSEQQAEAMEKMKGGLTNLQKFGQGFGAAFGRGIGQIGDAVGGVVGKLRNDFDMAVAAAEGRRAAMLAADPAKFAGAASRGSAEAFSTIMRERFRADPLARKAEKRQDKAEKQRENMNKRLVEIRDRIPERPQVAQVRR